MSATVEDYEVYKNDQNALAFFFYYQPELDSNDPNGPFSFIIEGENIVAGTKDHNIVFARVEHGVLDIAKQRGNILMMEFKDQQPFRATPCYLVDSF